MHRLRLSGSWTITDERLRERRPALARSVGALREAVVDFAAAAGASERGLEAIALAVSEALSNCVLHAYVGHDPPGPIDIEAWIDDTTLTVVVCDEGHGMVPRLDSPGLGIGLPLMAQMAERVDIQERGGEPGVCVRLSFALGGAA